MNLTRYNPWSMFDSLQRDINRAFERRSRFSEDDSGELLSSAWIPSVDVKDEERQVVLYADVPGIDPKDIHVESNNGVLTIKGERKFEKEFNEKDFHRIERSYGTFFRQFSLPDNVSGDDISAKYNNGVLEVRMPKKKASEARRISVQGS
ncbi:Hsp20/alpha crystallin family protein [Permianibacter aggregans]|uniref:Heat shock protein Hsp20 n=1 Tax=Permianibacter aggregans TaxID=1510150 RepID=A0A4R6UYL8_9GAMM|nr:Hsp20/alpha crystallin family protein [Permianibacter aggregans]QGX41290.1 Hsp20/alpha crystallin family protein [Permianibacter aggregans]TDQ51073.1 heat shock protein Hsp20 [Permianibacter aggregans]